MSATKGAPRARCRQLLGQLMALLDGELTADKRRQLERHLRSCECCGTMATNLRTVVALCQVEGQARTPARVRRAALARARVLVADARAAGAAKAR